MDSRMGFALHLVLKRKIILYSESVDSESFEQIGPERGCVYVSGDRLRSIFFTCMVIVFYAVTLSLSQRWLLACDPVTLHYLRTVILCVARSCCRA